MKKVVQCGIKPRTSCITGMFIAHQSILPFGKLVDWLTYHKHTTNKLLFDTYVNNKLLNGMPSVVAFYYQLAT